MSWPADLEKQWRLLLKNLEASSHGFFLVEFDRLFTRDAFLRRLQTEFESRQWQLEEVSLSDDHLATRLAADLCEMPCKAIVVRLDGATADHFGALNLSREALYDLPTNILFLTSQETHTRFLTSAHDLATWVHIPYSFALPEMAFPELPSLPPDIPITLAERIQYYEDQIRHTLEKDNRQKDNRQEAFGLLSPLADLYLDAAMYSAAERIYQVIATYYEQAADGRQTVLFTRRRDMAQGRRILADLRDGHLLLPEDRIHLIKLLKEEILSIHQKTLKDFDAVDEMGYTMSLSSPMLSTLIALAESVDSEAAGKLVEIRTQLSDFLIMYFSEAELRDLSFDMNVKYEELSGQGKVAKARELVAYLERRGRINELVKRCSELRPSFPLWLLSAEDKVIGTFERDASGRIHIIETIRPPRVIGES